MIFGYLVLAHLVADFLLQPGKLVKWKMESRWGVLVHVLVHFVTNIILLFPYIMQKPLPFMAAITAITAVHFFIDTQKIDYDLHHDTKVKPFVIDQIFHITTLFIAYLFLEKTKLTFDKTLFYSLYQNIYLVIFLTFTVLLSNGFEIFKFQLKREKNSKAKLKIDKKETLSRLLAFTIIYALFMIISLTVTR